MTITNTKKFNLTSLLIIKSLLYNLSTLQPQIRDGFQVQCFLTAKRRLHICLNVLERFRQDCRKGGSFSAIIGGF